MFVAAAAVALGSPLRRVPVARRSIRREQAKTLAEQRNAESAYRRERQRRTRRRRPDSASPAASVDELIRVSEEELAHRPGMEGLRKRLLASALAYYQEFIEQRRNDPDSQAELRDTTQRVETILADLAVLRAAGELYLLDPAARHSTTCGSTKASGPGWPSSQPAPGKRWMESFGDPDRLPHAAERVRLALEQARANEAEIDTILTSRATTSAAADRAPGRGHGGFP